MQANWRQPNGHERLRGENDRTTKSKRDFKIEQLNFTKLT